MVRSCVVPRCKTGYKSVKEKRSVFKVPADTERYQKWQAAIPGVILKRDHRVCDKHFEKKYILKEWVKRNSEGRIIAQAPYIHPRLAESAVPTIFDDPVQDYANTDDPVDSTLDAPKFFKAESENLQDHLHDVESDIFLPRENIQPEAHYQYHDVEAVSSHQHNVGIVEICVKDEDPLQTEDYSVASTSQSCVAVDSSSPVCRKNFHISDTIIEDWASDAATFNENPVTIPKAWAVTEYNEDGRQRVVFSNIVKTRANNPIWPIIDKSIEIKADRTLCYAVYGRLVNAEHCELPSVLTDTATLPQTLEKFKKLNVCNGLGAINVNHLSILTVFQDCLQTWRDNGCTMITKKKRCENCEIMRTVVKQRESRVKRKENRIHQVSNPFDKRKLIAVRKKDLRAILRSNYSKRHVRILTQSLI